MNQADFEARLPVWTALSELFLDTRLDEADYRRIAVILRQSKLPPDILRKILDEEVTPAFAFNACDIAGEWSPWSEDEVRQIMSSPRIETVLSGLFMRRLKKGLAAEWQKIAAFLPEET